MRRRCGPDRNALSVRLSDNADGLSVGSINRQALDSVVIARCLCPQTRRGPPDMRHNCRAQACDDTYPNHSRCLTVRLPLHARGCYRSRQAWRKSKISRPAQKIWMRVSRLRNSNERFTNVRHGASGLGQILCMRKHGSRARPAPSPTPNQIHNAYNGDIASPIQ